jgi:hypothetical protein
VAAAEETLGIKKTKPYRSPKPRGGDTIKESKEILCKNVLLLSDIKIRKIVYIYGEF